MTDGPYEPQWWIAREGQRHGPLSETEMRAFVEMRHLKPSDLVWREGFADWIPAEQAFAMPPAAADQRPSAVRTTEAPSKGFFSRRPAETVPAYDEPKTAPPKSARERFSLQDMLTRATPLTEEAPAGRPAAKPAAEASAPPPSFPFVRLIGIGAALSAAVVAAWLIAENYPAIMRTFGVGKAGAATATFSEGVTSDKLDERLQKVALWATIKKDFPNWYGDLMREAAKLSADDPQGAAMSKHLAEAIVALRRQNAEAALAAGPARLREIAEAFLKNLRALKQQSTTACYAFISQGETSPATLTLLDKPGDGRALQDQVAAIIAAISEGRSSPIKREKPSKADYDTLAASLMKLGWDEKDLKLFADPRALSSATPEKVCQMVQDWFSAHIAISDEAMQERLLVETLRPVVAG